jgi:hypothetical protein
MPRLLCIRNHELSIRNHELSIRNQVVGTHCTYLAIACAPRRRYNASVGLGKHVSAILMAEDILVAKAKFYRSLPDLLSPALQTLQGEDIDEEAKTLAVKGLALSTLQPLLAFAVLELGRQGFHRAEVLNLEWTELCPTFTGLHDLPHAAKRRYDGRSFTEAADCGCSGYGLFCCRSFQSVFGSGGTEVFGTTQALLSGIRDTAERYVADTDAFSTCPVCSFKMVNYMLNALYHIREAELSTRGVVVTAEGLLQNTRPQQGFVFPSVHFKRASTGQPHLLDESVLSVDYGRSRVADQVRNEYAQSK